MMNRREAFARCEMRIVQIRLRTPNRGPREAVRLRTMKKLVGRKALDQLLKQVVTINCGRDAILFFQLGKFRCSEYVDEANLIGELRQRAHLALEGTQAREHKDAVRALRKSHMRDARRSVARGLAHHGL